MSGGFDDPFLETTLGDAGEAVLAGRYRIVEELGRGAMGIVYKAEDLVLEGLHVAIKMPPAVLCRNTRAVNALKQEALLARKLAHPHIVTMRTIEEAPEGLFLVLDYVDGRSLEEVLAERGTLAEREVQPLFAPLAEALDYAHGMGVLHRDLKPSNILLDREGSPHLTDFGIARELKESVTRLTGQTISGTLPYMSPEQLLGKAPARPQDVYGLAATMYECLSGHPPFFRGDIPYQVMSVPPEPPTAESTPLAGSILKGLSKEPEDRPATCEALVHPRKQQPRRAKAWPFVLAMCVAILVAAGWWFLRDEERGSPLPNPPALQVKVRVTTPEDGTLLASRTVRVEGSATGGIDRIRVNDLDAHVQDGSWWADVFAREDGELRIQVTDDEGAVLARRRVVVDATPPVVVVDEPAEQDAITVTQEYEIRGRVRDAGAVRLRANGDLVLLDEDNAFAHQVHFEAPEQEHTVEFVATDEAGHFSMPVTRTITYRPPPAWLEDHQAFIRAVDDADHEEARRRLDQARAKGLTEAKLDTEREGKLLAWEAPPELIVEAPTDGAEIEGLEVTVRGRLLTNRPTDRVWIAGTAITVGPDGSFTHTLTYARPGTYRIVIEVMHEKTARLPSRELRVALKEEPPPMPPWARDLVSQEQIVAAKRHGVPVAFENEWKMRFVLIPEGHFLMGSPEAETAGDDFPSMRRRERPQHEVELTRPFYLQVTEVTNEQYRRFVPDHDSGSHEEYSLNEDDQPVVAVPWNDAKSFAKKLAEQGSARTYRLPTEAEWEYACRAGTTTRFSFGNDEAKGWRYANALDPKTREVFGWSFSGTRKIFGWSVSQWPKDDGFRVAAPVGTFLPNEWGLFDMHGNVAEWCADAYGPYTAGKVVDPNGPSGEADSRVVRGGSWDRPPTYLRSVNRLSYSPGARLPIHGFRLVSPLPETR